jgi:hypothetical protein
MPTRKELEQIVEKAYLLEKDRFGEEIQHGRQQAKEASALFGFMPNGWFLNYASTCSFLYRVNGDPIFARQARDGLFYYQDWLNDLPGDASSLRPEYASGVPPMEPVFQPVVFLPVVKRIQDTLSAADLAILADLVSRSFTPVWRFPEWGGHNRAMLRAAGLALAAQIFPGHPESVHWTRLADELAEESWGRWSIEDAMLYQPHWLRALVRYAEARSREEELRDFIQPRIYLKAITQLLSPLGILPDFGDSHWLMHSHWEWMACLEWGARSYRDPSMKWAAQRIFESIRTDSPDVYTASVALLAWEWCDESVPSRPPLNKDDALDDLLQKKIVWRTGWNPEAAYACLNYRDEGDYARVARDYLRQTLAVSAEKMHHGHADEGSFTMLVQDRTLLLHESGYRENPPDGIYRAAPYHNRLVWRKGHQPAGQSQLAFLIGDGSYHPTRTERLYQTRLGDIEYCRIRTTDENEGLVWDRSVIFLERYPCWIVADGVRSTVSAQRSLSTIWWTTAILGQGEDWFDTHIDAIQDWKNRRNSSLWIGLPVIPGQDQSRSVEPHRRSFQNELALIHTWNGAHESGFFIHFVSVLWPHRQADTIPVQGEIFTAVASTPYGRGIGISMRWRNEERLFGVLSDLECGVGQEENQPVYTTEAGLTGYGTLNSDAAFCAWRKQGEAEWAGFINGTRLEVKDRTLYQGLPHGMFQQNRTARPGIPKRFRWETGGK